MHGPLTARDSSFSSFLPGCGELSLYAPVLMVVWVLRLSFGFRGASSLWPGSLRLGRTGAVLVRS